MEAVNCKQTNKQTKKQTNKQTTNKQRELADDHHIWFCAYVHIRVKIYFFKEQWSITGNHTVPTIAWIHVCNFHNLVYQTWSVMDNVCAFWAFLVSFVLVVCWSQIRWSCGDPIHPTLFLIWYWPIFHTNEFERFWACLKLPSTVIPL
jgi:hypothetical protein